MNREKRYDSLIQYYSEENGLDWCLLKAQIKVESNFDPRAKSPAGAVGLPQFMRATWEEWKDGTVGIQQIFRNDYSRMNPEHSIRAQSAYMNWLFKRFAHISEFRRREVVLAAYNWGIGNVKRHLKNYGYFEKDLIPEETQKYIERINEYFTKYKSE